MRRLIGLFVLICLSLVAMGTVTPSHAQSHQVVLYVAEYCSHCRLAEQYLLERGVKVEIRDITQSARFHHEWKDIYHGDIVPVLVLDQGRFVLDGFERHQYDHFLKNHRIPTRN